MIVENIRIAVLAPILSMSNPPKKGRMMLGSE